MKKPLILFLVVFFAVIVRGDNYEKIEKLKEGKKNIAFLMHKKRVELIKITPSLKELHKKMVALHKELAIRIDNTSAMRKLITQQKQIDLEIKRLENE